MHKRSLLYPVILIALLGCTGGAGARSAIFFVGDGTGLAQLAAARLACCGPDGRLALDSLEHLAVMTTHAANALTTDSAAGATAWATGRKTNNRFLAVDPQRQPLRTLLEYARDAGLGTGLVTSTTLTHATPAAFAAHLDDRGAEAEIAAQMLASRPNVMLGGGKAFWAGKAQRRSRRKDERDLLAEARQAGYQVVHTGSQLRKAELGKTPYLLGLFAWGNLPYGYDQRGQAIPSLAQMTSAALEVLDPLPKGFFLMVEGGRIDHGGHSNDANRLVWEAIAFDQAVSVGLEYARKHPDTLVLFAADHETGGLSVANEFYEGFPQVPFRDGFPERGVDLKEALRLGWTTGGHTGIPVLAAAWGPGAEQIRGVMDNTELFGVMMQALGLKESRP